MAELDKNASSFKTLSTGKITSAFSQLMEGINSSWPSPVIAPSQETAKEEKPVRRYRRRRDPITIERANLLNVCKLVIKELIDSSLSQGRMLDDDFVPLQQFFVVLEHVFRHGLRPKKGLFGDKKDFWCILEHIQNFIPDAVDITTSVKDMPNAKTLLGRSRAWLRLALMQKKLADYFKVLLDNKDELICEFYEPGSIMLEEEGTIIGGLLVGLNVIDCNICIKEADDLDEPIGVIDFSLYLKNNQDQPDEDERTNPEGDAKMAAILDQKNYLEELNRHLNATVTNLQQKLETTNANNTLLKEDLAITKNQLLALQTENATLKQENELTVMDHQKKLDSAKHGSPRNSPRRSPRRTTVKSAKQDIDVEREVYQTSRAGLDSLYSDTKKQLDEETQLRLDVEKELQLQISMKAEIEMAMRLLEKDIHEKQDSIVSLRKQLDDVKKINIEMYQKLQTCESSLKHKTELVTKLEQKTVEMASMLKNVEEKLKHCSSDKSAAEETARSIGQQLVDRDSKRSALETDLKIEREWRSTLQRSLEAEKEKCAGLLTDLSKMKKLQEEHSQLLSKHEELNVTCREQEEALRELGSHLSESKLKMEDMKESHLAMKEAQWQDDSQVTNCKKCTKQFSVSRRKHHCRNCGDIFCNECSDNKMPLPSSAKPVRVCDVCQELLLNRYSAN